MIIIEKRKNIRLKTYDYSCEGYYFITICTKDKRCILSRIEGESLENTEIKLTHQGTIAEEYIKRINEFYDNVIVDKFVIMPNHIHFIIIIEYQGNATIPSIIQQFKGKVSKELGASIWQKSFYEHIIRNEKEYLEIVKYIDENPGKWAQDKYFVL